MSCAIAGCTKFVHAKGYCNTHYRAMRRGDDPNAPRRTSPGTLARWTQEHANYDGEDCLIWPFSTVGAGYAATTRMMCEIVNGPPPTEDHEVAHSCGKGHLSCIHPKHLRWATRQENIADKIIHGTIKKGSEITTAKLSEDQIPVIRSLAGRSTQADIAAQFGVAQTTIGRILRGEAWRHVP